MDKVFIDSSAWIALVSFADKSHQKIDDDFKILVENHARIFTSNDIVDETVTRLAYDLGWRKAQKFVERVQELIANGNLIQLWTDEKIQQDAFEILAKFDDQKLSLTDATTVVIMQRFKLDAVLTLDSDFEKIGISTINNTDLLVLRSLNKGC